MNNMSLYREQAIIQFADALLMLDGDQVLEAAGLCRSDLIALTNDEAISACIDIRREAVLATPYKFLGDTTGFIEAQVMPHLKQISITAHDAIYYGYSVLENIYRKDGSRVVLDKCLEKPFYWFLPDRYGGLYYDENMLLTRYEQSVMPVNAHLVDTRYKFMLTRYLPTHDNPRGAALLSSLYWPAHFRRSGWKFWVQFLERSAIPKLVGKSGDVTSMATALADAVQDATISVGRDDEVMSLETSSTGESFKTLEVALIKRIQMKILGRVLTGDLESGSYAAQEIEEGLPAAKRQTDIALVSATVQRVCDALADLNGLPKIIFRMDDYGGLNKDRAERDKILVDSNMLKFSKSYLQREYNLNPDDFEIPTVPVVASRAAMSLSLAAEPAKVTLTPDQQEVDDLIDLTESLLKPDYSKVLEIIKAAATEGDMLQALDAHVAGLPMDSDRDGLLERSFFLAEVLGYTNAATGKGEPLPRPNDPDGQ